MYNELRRLFQILHERTNSLLRAYHLTFQGSMFALIRITLFAVMGSLFELLGTAFSMQALISTIAEGRAVRAANIVLHQLGLHYRFDAHAMVSAAIIAMIACYILAVIFTSLKNLGMAQYRRKKQAQHLPNDFDQRIFCRASYNTELLLAEKLTKLLEALIFAIVVFSFLLWLSFTFAMVILSVLSFYALGVLWNRKREPQFRDAARSAAKQVQKLRHASNAVEVRKFFKVQEETKIYKMQKERGAQLLFILAMTMIVVTAAIIFDPGELLVLPILLILAIRKLLGSARVAANQLSFILESRD